MTSISSAATGLHVTEDRLEPLPLWVEAIEKITATAVGIFVAWNLFPICLSIARFVSIPTIYLGAISTTLFLGCVTAMWSSFGVNDVYREAVQSRTTPRLD